jgi:hypothetical protein
MIVDAIVGQAWTSIHRDQWPPRSTHLIARAFSASALQDQRHPDSRRWHIGSWQQHSDGRQLHLDSWRQHIDGRRLHPDERWHLCGRRLIPDGRQRHPNERGWHPDDRRQHPDGWWHPDERWLTSTQQHHRQHDSIASLKAWLSGDIMPRLAPTRQRCRQHDSVTSSSGQTIPSHLLAQDDDLTWHIMCGRVRFTKDHCPTCVDQGRKYLPSSYFIIFSLSNTYMHIKPGVTLAWLSVMPRPSSPRQCHR